MANVVVRVRHPGEFLTNRTEKEYEPMKFEFPDEDLLAIFQIEDESTQEDT